MSEMTDTPHRRRNRAGEAGERRRGADHAAGRCITCGRPSRTWRCTSCTRELELRTERYRGKGTRGPATKSAADALDLRLAMEELGRARAELDEIARLGEAPRRKVELEAVPIARVLLVRRMVADVLRRHRIAQEKLAAPPMSQQLRKPRDPQLSFRWPAYMGAR